MLGSRDIGTTRQIRTIGDCRLSINRLSMMDNDQTLTIDDLQVHAGEVFGIAGVAGNGQGLLFAALSGELTANDNSAVTINGTASGASGPNQRRTLGAMFVPEERLGHAAVPSFWWQSAKICRWPRNSQTTFGTGYQSANLGR